MKATLKESIAKFNSKIANINFNSSRKVISGFFAIIVGWSLCVLFINKFYLTVNFLPVLMTAAAIVGMIFINKVDHNSKEEVATEE
jgi:hypothetical protein